MPTHYQGSRKEKTALDTYIKLMRAAETLSSRLNQHFIKTGLTESQFAVLEALFHLGPLFQRELGEKILRSGGNITLVIDNLEKQGLVKRERGKQDRRLFTVYLTGEGKTLMEKIFPPHVKLISEEMNILTEAEQLELQRMLKILGKK